MEKKITKKQRAFIDMYVFEDLGQGECAHRAGYKNPDIIAHRLLNDPQYEHVQNKIDELRPDKDRGMRLPLRRWQRI